MRSSDALLGLTDCLQKFAAGDQAARERLLDICGMRTRGIANRLLVMLPGGGQCDTDDEVLVSAAFRLRAVLTALGHAPPRLALALAVAGLRRVIFDVVARRSVDNRRTRGAARTITSATLRLRWTALFTAIDALPPLHREVFHLVWFLGADPRTVSRLTGRSTRTVRRCWRESRDAVAHVVESTTPHGSSADPRSFSAVA